MARSIDLHLPAYHQPRQRRSLFLPFCRFGGVGLFLASAAVFGILFHVLVFGFLNLYYGPGEPPYNRWREPPSTFDLHPDAALLHSPNQLLSSTSALPSSTSAPPPSTTPVPSSTSVLPSSTPTSSSVDSEELTMDELRDMVSSTKGFLARDYSLGLGWNNVGPLLLSRHFLGALIIRSWVAGRRFDTSSSPQLSNRRSSTVPSFFRPSFTLALANTTCTSSLSRLPPEHPDSTFILQRG